MKIPAPSSVHILEVTPDDIEYLVEVSRQTFRETFGPHNTKHDIEKYLKEQLSEDQLVRELHNKNSTFFFAKSGAEVIGYLKLNTGEAQTEVIDPGGMEVERIYILEEYQGKGYGQQLLEKAVTEARNQNLSFIWLGVWERNTKAIEFYKKYGFTHLGVHTFVLGDDKQRDLILRLNL